MDFIFTVHVLLAACFGIVPLLVLFVMFRSRNVSDYGERYVLITGCDSGFGKMAAIRLDQLGFQVFAGCLTEEGERQLQAVCSKRVVTLRLDVTDSTQIEQAVWTVSSHLPKDTGLWGLINNAGVFWPGFVDWHSSDAYRKMADINLWGLVDVTLAFLPLIKKARGRIVNTSSIAGLFGLPGFAPYCITKFGVEGFSDVLRREMRLWNVLVSVVEPGAHRTNIVARDSMSASIEKTWNSSPKAIRDEYGEEFFRKAKEGYCTWGETSSSATQEVVDAYIDAVTSQRPRPRYLVGTDGRMFSLVNKLPESLGDWIMERNAFLPTKLTKT